MRGLSTNGALVIIWLGFMAPGARAQDVQFNIIVMEKSWFVKEISCLEVMDFVKYLNGSPNAFFLPRPQVGWERRPGLLAACKPLTHSQIHSDIFKPLKFSKVTITHIFISFWVNFHRQAQPLALE